MKKRVGSGTGFVIRQLEDAAKTCSIRWGLPQNGGEANTKLGQSFLKQK